MTMSQPHTVLIDLERRQPALSLAQGAHPLGLSPARLPCAIMGDDLVRLQAFAAGDTASCDVALTFRFQDLNDLGVLTIQNNDVLTGLFATSGAVLVLLHEDAYPVVKTTFATGGGLSVWRPGRHLLCAHFSARRRTTATLNLSPAALAEESSVLGG